MSIVEFSPPSLSSIEAPPVFLLRRGARDDRRRVRHLLIVAGLRTNGRERLRAEILTALRVLWSSEVLAEHEPRLIGYWNALDQHVATDGAPFVHPEQVAMDDLIERLVDAWQPLREMLAENARFHEDAPKLVLGSVLTGWRSLGVPFKRAEGVVPIECIDEIECALRDLEINISATSDIGAAFSELLLEATGDGRLTVNAAPICDTLPC